MTVYNINLGIGWASSGVEYAQAYRADVFKRINQPAKFIFTDMIVTETLQHLTSNIGLADEDVVWLYGFFTDIATKPASLTLDQLKATLDLTISKVERTGKSVRYYDDVADAFVTAYCNDDTSDIVQRVEYVSKGILIRKDYFTSHKLFSEYYVPKDGRAVVYLRRFFNQDGSVAYEENVDGDNSVFRFPNQIFYSKVELVAEMMRRLNLTSQDLVILDRTTGIGQAVFRNHGAAKLAVVIHAEHFSPNAVTDTTILWNNYYEYAFSNADKVDAFIASTQVQKDLLASQFAKYTKHHPTIYAIPVGSLDKLTLPENGRKPYSLVTASRLASEKHIDWLVNAVILAKKDLPELTFDIYGAGGQQATLEKIITDHNAGDYIKLMGHRDLSNVYQQYDAYLAGSTSEGFGLTLLEAIGSGLPIIGLDVRYGNQTFIDDGQNGYLIPRKEPDDASQMAQAFAQKIKDLFTNNQLPAFQAHSYEKAKPFLTSHIEQMWRDFVKEMTA